MSRWFLFITSVLIYCFSYALEEKVLFSTRQAAKDNDSLTINVQDLRQSRNSDELIDPLSLYPLFQKMDGETFKLLKEESDCLNKQMEWQKSPIEKESKKAESEQKEWQKPNKEFESINGVGLKNGNIKKLSAWVQFHCHKQPLPEAFFESPPYMSPWGDSWVIWAYSTSHKEFQSDQWLLQNKAYTHLLETGLVPAIRNSLSEIEALTQDLSPSQFHQLLNGENEVITESHSFKLIPMSNPYQYKVSELNHLPFYQTKIFIFSLTFAVLVALILVIGLTARLISVKQKHQKDRELMMQTLTHELRHPVTSLQLSMEVYRNHFEIIPSEVQTEFLRMTGQIQRLFRIIHASGQYLTTKKDSSFQFNVVEIKSIYEFISELLFEYENKLTYQLDGDDCTFHSDPYWLGVCITNLIKNSLIHGKTPITVSVKCHRDIFEFSITDQGQIAMNLNDITTPFLKSKSSSGMGLGLSIVYRIIDRMGGKLELRTHPTQFYFYVKGLKNEKNLAS